MPVNSYHWHFAKHIQNSVRLRVLIFGNVIAHLVYIHLYQWLLGYYLNAFQHCLALLGIDGAQVDGVVITQFDGLAQFLLANATEHDVELSLAFQFLFEVAVLVGDKHGDRFVGLACLKHTDSGVGFALIQTLVHQHTAHGGLLCHHYC